MPTDLTERIGDDTPARNISVITAEIQFYKNQAGEAILEIGRRLIEAKEQLQHGEWLGWLRDSVDISEITAQRLMRIARECPNPSLVSDLGYTKVLTLLALPDAERDDFIAENPVDDMSKRELEQAIRERKEAQEARAVAEHQAEVRQRMLREALKKADTAKAEAARARDDKAALERRLEELRSMEPDPQVIDDARKEAAAIAKREAEEKLRLKIAAVDEAKSQAETDRLHAEQELERIKAEREQEKADLSAKIQHLENQLETTGTSSQTLAVFKTYFESVQVSLNKMLDCIQEVEDDTTRSKLSAALSALCNKVLEQAAEGG